MLNPRDRVRRDLEALEGSQLADGALGYVLVVIRSLGTDRDQRAPAPGDSVSIREVNLTPGQSQMALRLALQSYDRTPEDITPC